MQAPYLGDFIPGATFDFKFSTPGIDGVLYSLTGSPVVKAYKGNSTTTEVTTGLTLTPDFDGVTGFHNLRVVLTDAFYAAGSDIALVITTGTVNTISQAGRVLANFSILGRAASTQSVVGAIATSTSNTRRKFKTTLTQTVKNFCSRKKLIITSGALAGQEAKIRGFNPDTDFIWLEEALTATPADGVTFAIV